MIFTSAALFVVIGNDIMKQNKKISQKTEAARFRAHFGCGPSTCSDLWKRIDPSEVPDNSKPEHLLWGLMLLKLYCAESVLCTLAGGAHEQTFRKWSWTFAEAISELQCSVILWENRFVGDIGNECLVSVDGTDFQIYQWKPFWKGWFSHKFKGPGVRYEVGVCIRTGSIVWFNGPFPCGKWPDINTFRQGMKHCLRTGEKVQADLGHRGEALLIVTPDETSDTGRAVQARHETINKRFKQFAILHRVFRHDVRKHQVVFGAVAVITQLAIEHGEPLYQVDCRET